MAFVVWICSWNVPAWKRKTISEEMSTKEILSNVIEDYKIQVHKVIIGRVKVRMRNCFYHWNHFYTDLTVLPPRTFQDLRESVLVAVLNDIEAQSWRGLNKQIMVTRSELRSLGNQWETLKGSALEEYNLRSTQFEWWWRQGVHQNDHLDHLNNKAYSASKNCAVTKFYDDAICIKEFTIPLAVLIGALLRVNTYQLFRLHRRDVSRSLYSEAHLEYIEEQNESGENESIPV